MKKVKEKVKEKIEERVKEKESISVRRLATILAVLAFAGSCFGCGGSSSNGDNGGNGDNGDNGGDEEPAMDAGCGIAFHQAIDNNVRCQHSESNRENWFAQSSVTHDGTDAVQSGRVEAMNEKTCFSFFPQGPSIVTFQWKLSPVVGQSGPYNQLLLYKDDRRIDALNGERDWSEKRVDLGSQRSYDLKLCYRKDLAAQGDGSWIDRITIRSTATTVSFQEALDTSLTIRETSPQSDVPWYTQTEIFDRGASDENNDAIRSGPIGHGQKSCFETIISSTEPFRFFYKYKISSEESGDFLAVYVDGEPHGNKRSGLQDWSSARIVIEGSSADRTITFCYEKNESGSAGEDAVWIDDFSIVPF